MNENIRTVGFKTLPIDIEVKDMQFTKKVPKLLGQPHKAAFFQVIWLTEGNIRLYVDFREIVITSGELLIIAAGQVCQFDTDCEYAGKMILFTDSFFNMTEQDSNLLYTSEILNPVNLNKAVILNKSLISNLFAQLENELKQQTDSFQINITQSFLRIIILEAERQLVSTYPPTQNSLGRKFYNEVERRFKENRNIQYYVQLLGISEKVLSKEVKTLTGKTPKAYIDYRITLEAKRLLSYSNLSAKEIGFELGFDEPTNFNKYFRKNTGFTPVSFRNSKKPAE